MKIKKISTIEIGKGVFRCDHALVETVDGQQYVYSFEYSDTWKDLADYLDNVKSDFENEWEDTANFGTEEMGLFLKKELWEQ